MRNLITAVMMLSAVPATAQTATWDGPGPQPVVYQTGQVGDGSNAFGGTPPAYARAPADRPTTVSTTGFTYTATNVIKQTGEIKFRVICGVGLTNKDDFIKYPGVVGGSSHKHDYLGNTGTNALSTFASERDNPFSTCQGGPLWNQAYWHPSMCKTVGAAELCVKPDYGLFYYSRGSEDKGKLVSLPNFTRIIFGVPMEDATDSIRKAEVPAGYTYETDGFLGWTCTKMAPDNVTELDSVISVNGTKYYRSLRTEGGADPFQGQCKRGDRLQKDSIAPQCWDGQNLSSPNGRDHFRYKIKRNSDGKYVCPDKWYDVPDLSARSVWTLRKDAEYFVDKWHLASDMGNLPGSMAHDDWAMTVDRVTWDTVMASCLGIAKAGYTAIGGDCGTGGINNTTILSGGAAPAGSGYTTPILKDGPKYNLPAKQRWWPLDTGTRGPFTIQHNH